MRLLLLSLLLVCSVSTISLAQPVNNECSGAIALGAAPFCPDRVFSTVGATASAVAVPTCWNGGNVQRDVWFTFQTTGTLTEVSVFVNGLASGPNRRPLFNPQVALYRGSCGSLSELACANVSNAAQVRLDARNLSPNTTYYLRVNDFSATASPNTGDFTLCVRQLVPDYALGQGITGSGSCFGRLFDSGGANGNYKDQENYTFTICPDQPFSCLEIEMVDFETEGVDNLFGDDRLNFYAGTSNRDPLIASVYGVSDGSPFIIQSASKCVTVEFISDFFINLPGFELKWQCSALPCDGSSFNPTVISKIPYEGKGLSTCNGKATVGASACANDRFMAGPDHVFRYESPGNMCVAIELSGAKEGTGIVVLDAPPSNPAAKCIAVGSNGKIGSANLSKAGTYYIVVSKDIGCTDFDIRIRQVTCALSPALADALRRPLNGCRSEDDLPSIFVFEDGFQDMDMREGINSGCWLNVGEEAAFYWFTIQAQSEGTLGFILESADVPSDVDFNVWGPFTTEQVVNNPQGVIDFIKNNQPIRSSWAAGPEPTGMVVRNPLTGRPVTDAYDCEENSGATGDDFVRIINTKPGEVYVILVNDWGNQIKNGGISVDWSPSSLGLLDPVEPKVVRGDTAICRGDAAQILVDVGTSTIRWITNTNTLSCTNCPNPVARPLATTRYQAVVESICYSDTIEVEVEVLNVSAGPDQQVCRFETIQIVGGSDFPNATYRWTATPATGLEFSCTDCAAPLIRATQPGNYRIRVELTPRTGNCRLSDEMILSVNSSPAPQFVIAKREVDICRGDSVEIGINPSEAGLRFAWFITPNNIISREPTFRVSPTATTKYYVQVSNNTCALPSLDSVLVRVSNPPLIQVHADTLLCVGDTIQLGFGPRERDVTYLWDGPETVIDRDNPRTKAIPLNSGRYTLTAVRGACEVSESFEANVNPTDVDIPQGDTLFLCSGNKLTILANVRNPGAQNLTPVWTSSDPAFGTRQGGTIEVSPKDSTVYRVEVSFQNCRQTDSVLVVVDSLPADLKILPKDTSICEGAYVILRTAAYETKDYRNLEFKWMPSEGQQSPDSLLNLVVTPDTTTVYYRITTQGACRDSTAAKVTVKPIPDLRVIPSDTLVCPGEVVQLELIGPDKLEKIMWTPPNGLSCTDCRKPKVTAITPVQFNVMAELDGCPGSASAVVNVQPSPQINLTNNRVICQGSSVQLNSALTPGASYVWTSTDPNFGRVTDPRPVVTPTRTTTYYVTASFPGLPCDPVNAEITIQVIGQVTVQASVQPARVCSGDPVVLKATVTGGGGGDSFVWTSSNGRQFIGAEVTVRPDATTTYFLTYVSAGGCQTINRSVSVQVDPGVTVSIETDAAGEVPEGTEVTLNANIKTDSPDPVTIVWTENGAPVPGGNVPQVKVRPKTDGTRYVVKVTTSGGCMSSDTIAFDVTEPQFTVPNAFTPNGDGKNDRFRVLYTGNIDRIVRFQVYNRWGQVVYDNNDADEGWDGTFNGKPQASDVYVYVIVVRTLGGVERVEKGEVTLIR